MCCSFLCNCQLLGQQFPLLLRRRLVQKSNEINSLLCHHRLDQELFVLLLSQSQTFHYSTRNCLLLLFTSTGYILAMPRAGPFLEDQIPIPLKSISDGTPCQICPHHMCCNWDYFSSSPSSSYHVSVCPWEVYGRNS